MPLNLSYFIINPVKLYRFCFFNRTIFRVVHFGSCDGLYFIDYFFMEELMWEIYKVNLEVVMDHDLTTST